MPIVHTPDQFNVDDLFVHLLPTLGVPVYLKCESFNFAGSIKLKAARNMIDAAERAGDIGEGSILLESSSGNLGLALAMICAHRGYDFMCVTDNRCGSTTQDAMRVLGADVHVVEEPAEHGGMLGARLEYVKRLCAEDERYVWLNQYANAANWQAHFDTTGPALLRQFPDLDVLVVGAGTSGTLMGCARYLREHSPRTRIVAVDVAGSVTFGGEPGPRHIPGLGAGLRPSILDSEYVDDVVMVHEAAGIRANRRLADAGFLFGGSTGQVVSGAEAWLVDHGSADLTVAAIAPDLGDRYLTTVYSTEWALATGLTDGTE